MTPKGKIRARRRALAVLVGAVLLVAVLLFAVFPTRSWWQQRQETAQVQGELAEVRAATARVEQEQEQLETDEIAGDVLVGLELLLLLSDPRGGRTDLGQLPLDLGEVLALLPPRPRREDREQQDGHQQHGDHQPGQGHRPRARIFPFGVTIPARPG